MEKGIYIMVLSNTKENEANLKKAIIARQEYSDYSSKAKESNNKFKGYIKLIDPEYLETGFDIKEHPNNFSYNDFIDFLLSKDKTLNLLIQEFEAKNKTTHKRYTIRKGN
tara:strand:+ start:594 stop:923 length:330 start_codon:yes stop_codon:yes gene_type:complete